MGMPGWWAERRYGIYLDASLATVPAWAPIGASAERYRNHLGEIGGDEGTAPEPFVEVLAHHRDRWGHLGSYDDFAPLLDFAGFDAEQWAEFVVHCGAGYAALTLKHDDGWCWWDAPHAPLTMLDAGPRRNVVAEFATACERNDLVLGGFYSVDDEPGDEAAGREGQLRDLIDRVGLELLFADIGTHGDAAGSAPRVGPRVGADATTPVASPTDSRVVFDRRIAALLGTEATEHITTFADDPPDDIVLGPWQLCRPVGASLCRNRAERESHQLTAVEIVATLTEVVAKGGNLLLGLGPDADGTIAGPGRVPLLEAAEWIRGHDHLLRDARPWSAWGDEGAHYWVTDGVLHIADIAGDGRFRLLGSDDHAVQEVAHASPGGGIGTIPGPAVQFEQDERGLRLSAPHPRRGRSERFPLVYRVVTSPRERAGELFAPTEATAIALAPLLADARRGAIVNLGDAVYEGPATVPAGVTLRGLGPARTHIATEDGPITVGEGARLEHLTVGASSHPDPARAGTRPVDGERPAPAPGCMIEGNGATVLGCRIDGQAAITGDGVTVRATRLDRLRATDVDGTRISHCRFFGSRASTAVELFGGRDGEVDSCEFAGHRLAIHVVESSGAAIAGNHIESHHCAVHLERADNTHIHGNLVIGTMRAVDVDGGSNAVVDGNAVFDGDSGCVVRGGATGCEISGNHWERCRIGVLGWNAGDIREADNHGVDLYEPENRFVTGP